MDDIERRANALEVRVNAEAKRAMATPGCAGYVPEHASGGRYSRANTKAAYLRGVAAKLVGPEWQWRITQFSDGDAIFVITRYNPEERSATR